MRRKTMGISLALIILSFYFSEAGAGEPAYKRECRLAQGIYLGLEESSTPLCFWDDRLVIDAASLAHYRWNEGATMAVQAFFSGPSLCADWQGQNYQLSWDHKVLYLCRFADGSVLSVWPLQSGPDLAVNARLKAALTPYHLPRELPDLFEPISPQVVVQSAEARGLQTLSLESLRSEKSLHEHLARYLDFPPFYGHNLDALYDILSDKALWGHRRQVPDLCLTETASFARRIGLDRWQLWLDVFNEAALANPYAPRIWLDHCP